MDVECISPLNQLIGTKICDWPSSIGDKFRVRDFLHSYY